MNIKTLFVQLLAERTSEVRVVIHSLTLITLIFDVGNVKVVSLADTKDAYPYSLSVLMKQVERGDVEVKCITVA